MAPGAGPGPDRGRHTDPLPRAPVRRVAHAAWLSRPLPHRPAGAEAGCRLDGQICRHGQIAGREALPLPSSAQLRAALPSVKIGAVINHPIPRPRPSSRRPDASLPRLSPAKPNQVTRQTLSRDDSVTGDAELRKKKARTQKNKKKAGKGNEGTRHKPSVFSPPDGLAAGVSQERISATGTQYSDPATRTTKKKPAHPLWPRRGITFT